MMNNGLAATKLRMFVGKKHAGERWTDVLKSSDDYFSSENMIDKKTKERGKAEKKTKKKVVVQVNSKGYADFPVASMGVGIWVNAEADGRNRFERSL